LICVPVQPRRPEKKFQVDADGCLSLIGTNKAIPDFELGRSLAVNACTIRQKNYQKVI